MDLVYRIWTHTSPSLFYVSDSSALSVFIEGCRFVTCESFLKQKPKTAEECLEQDQMVKLNQVNECQNETQTVVAFRNAYDDLALLCSPPDSSSFSSIYSKVSPLRVSPFVPSKKLFILCFVYCAFEVQVIQKFRNALTLILKSDVSEACFDLLRRGTPIVTEDYEIVAITKVTALHPPLMEATIIREALPRWAFQPDSFEYFFQLDD